VSKGIPEGKPGYYGFFTEDEFLGGQPQFFATFNIAEVLYDALHTWDYIGYLEVTPVSLKFFKPIVRGVKTGKYKKGTREYKAITLAVKTYAEDVFALLAKATPKDYVLVESINKTSGEPMGPRGMIRSLTAALSAIDARGGMTQIPWDGRAPNSKMYEAEADVGELYWSEDSADAYDSEFDDQEVFGSDSVWSAEEDALLENLYTGHAQTKDKESCAHEKTSVLTSVYNRLPSLNRPSLSGSRWANFYAAQGN